MEQLDSHESWQHATLSTETFWNAVQAPELRYSGDAKGVNGILIDFKEDIVVTRRRIYSLSNWLAEVGGFAFAVQCLLAVFYPLLPRADLQNYLITRLYKNVSGKDVVYSEAALTPFERLKSLAKNALRERRSVK